MRSSNNDILQATLRFASLRIPSIKLNYIITINNIFYQQQNCDLLFFCGAHLSYYLFVCGNRSFAVAFSWRSLVTAQLHIYLADSYITSSMLFLLFVERSSILDAERKSPIIALVGRGGVVPC